MTLRKKLIIGTIVLGSIPALLGILIVGLLTTSSGRALIEKQSENQLISVREMTAENIEEYFVTIQNQILTMSRSQSTIEAMNEFYSAFFDYAASVPLDEDTEGRLKDFYDNEFGASYRSANPNSATDPATLLGSLSENTRALQSTFISENENPLGEKDLMTSPDSFSAYGLVHARFHESFRDFLHTFDFYDVFLVEADQGQIVYSVFKEIDFGTSLLTGPFADSGIAEAFNAVKDSEDPNEIYLTDFASYTPSYESSAAFIASPIFQKTRLVGVLIFQMPIGRINELMTHNESWSSVGLGETGQTYLVGERFHHAQHQPFLSGNAAKVF